MERNTALRRGRTIALALLAAAALGACEQASGAGASANRTAYGEPVRVGQGTARAYVTTKNGVPAEVGVALSEAALAGLPDQLDEILANESPEQAKELLRLLIKEIRVHDRRRIVPTYRVPAAVRAMPREVELAGLEPATAEFDPAAKYRHRLPSSPFGSTTVINGPMASPFFAVLRHGYLTTS
jgi:hypothetical protein